MKNILLASVLLITSFYSIAQQQIPNGDFELWGKYSNCPIIDSIVNFITQDEIEYFCNVPSINGIYKTTESYGGETAIKITARNISPIGSVANNIRIGTDFTNPDQGIAFSSKPYKLIGYYKGIIDGEDTLGITITLKNADGIVAEGKFVKLSHALNPYSKFEIILNYNNSNTSSPESLTILVSLGTKSQNNQLSENTGIYFDYFSFDYNIPTSVTSYTSVSPINVYAANKNINFSENVSDVHVVDMVGAQKMTASTDTKTLNAGSLTTGMYIVTYKYNDAYFSKKIVIE